MSRTIDAVYIVSILAVIALAATVFALLLQRYFGRSVLTVAAGPAFAFCGVLLFTRLSKKRR
jgi:heme/copper-type cytochrome/quinol oxidase subunit 1